MKFSLIVATYGRCKEVEMFLKSIENINYNRRKIEIVIIDQNEDNRLETIVSNFKDMNIIHIKSDIKGLSQNRNIGIKNSSGDVIAFPDDDCEYLPDTLEKVEKAFKDHESDMIMGRIAERDGSDSLRTWPKSVHTITKSNFYTRCSSITMFFKRSESYIYLNEKLGVGNYFGSCEDTDILYRNLKNDRKVVYDPSIIVYHPHYDSKQNMTEAKVYSYGLGFGGFVKDNLDLNTLILFSKAEAFHFLKALINLAKFDFQGAKKSLIAFMSRIKGLIKF